MQKEIHGTGVPGVILLLSLVTSSRRWKGLCLGKSSVPTAELKTCLFSILHLCKLCTGMDGDILILKQAYVLPTNTF
jgi:hypothetical protein